MAHIAALSSQIALAAADKVKITLTKCSSNNSQLMFKTGWLSYHEF